MIGDSSGHAVLVVEDDAVTAELERRALVRSGMTVQIACCVREAIFHLERRAFSAVVLDYRLPDGEPWVVLEVAKSRSPSVPVILATGMGSEHIAAEAVRRGIDDYVRKGDTFLDDLPILVDRIIERTAIDERSREVTARLAAIVESSEDAIYSETLDGIVLSWNPAAERLYGYTAAEMIGRPTVVLIPKGSSDLERLPYAARVGETLRGYETVRVRKGGGLVDVALTVSPIRNVSSREVVGISTIARDITERTGATDDLARFFELSLDMLCTAGSDGYFRRLNPAFTTTLGYDFKELRQKPFLDFVHPDDVQTTLAQMEKLAQGVPTIYFENRYRCKDGTYRWLAWRSTPDASGTVYAAARDITQAKMMMEEKAASLKEKEVLLKEVHHRVKNNLQVISSIINMQARNLASDDARGALEECQTRIQAISLIHEKLYQSRNYSSVQFSDYARGLAGSIFRASRVSPTAVTLDLNIETVSLAIDRAIPCGLILHELITNALKHAFPSERRGLVRVELSTLPDRKLLLSVSDDGIGLPASFDIEKSDSMGMQLLTTLVEQLDGQLDIARPGGTTFNVTFPMEG